MWFRQRQRSGQTRIAAVLDAGSHKICCLIGRVTPPASALASAPAQVQLLGYSLQQSEGISAGYVIDMDSAEAAIRKAIAKAEHMADVVVQGVYVTASAGRLVNDRLSAKVPIGDDGVREGDVDEAIAAGRRHAAQRGRIPLHTRAIGFAIGAQTGILDPRGMTGETLAIELHSVLAEPAPLANLRLCLEKGHIRMLGFAAPVYVGALAVVTPEEASSGVLVIDMGAGSTGVAVFSGGTMIYADSVKAGGQVITRDLAKFFSISFAEAERLKTLHGSVFSCAADETGSIMLSTLRGNGQERWLSLAKPEVCAIIRRRQDDIFQRLWEGLRAGGMGPESYGAIVLTGGGSQLVGASTLAERIFGAPARLGAPRPFFSGPSPDIGPAHAAAAGFLSYLHADGWTFAFDAHKAGRVQPGGYFARVGAWLSQAF